LQIELRQVEIEGANVKSPLGKVGYQPWQISHVTLYETDQALQLLHDSHPGSREHAKHQDE
jgi:hypothetical protein